MLTLKFASGARTLVLAAAGYTGRWQNSAEKHVLIREIYENFTHY